MSIEEMKNVDVRMVKREELTDIREVEVNKRKSQEGQIKDYLEQIKNPYCYRYGEYIVKIGFEDTTVTLTGSAAGTDFKNRQCNVKLLHMKWCVSSLDKSRNLC